MATRFRLPSSGAPPVSPAFQAGYTHNNGVRRNMPTTTVGDASTLTTTAQTPDSADHLVNGSTLHWQGTSAPLAAQTIAAQTVTLTVQGLEANAANNLFLALAINVFSADGATQLGTIFAGGLDATELSTSLQSRTMAVSTSAFTITSGNAGARIVAEISLSGTPTATTGVQGHNGSIRWGSNGAGGDLLANDSQTGTTLNGWLEFANTLTFVTASGTLSTTLDDATCAATGVALASGSLSTTMDAITVAAAGTVSGGVAGIEGTLAATLDPASSTATGLVRVGGTATNTLGAMAVAGTGVAAVRGSVGSTLGTLALASTGKVAVSAALAKTLDALASSGVGVVAGVGGLNVTLDAISSSATGAVAISGSVTQTFDAMTVVASGGIPVPSQINIPLFARTGILLIGSEII